MIYLVSNQQTLFQSTKYQCISAVEALKILEPLQECECDTETMGLDPYTKPLLTIQLGNKDNQIVFDVTQGIWPGLKEFLESDRTFLFWNAQFDLMYLYHYNIWVNHVYDGMLAEQLIYLGYDNISYSLKEAAHRYDIAEIDKSVRGVIINEGLTERVVVYAAGDVMYLSEIRDKQMQKIREEHLENAIHIENEFVKCLAYIKYCGVHLDAKKWKTKMISDQQKMDTAITDLNNWVVRYFYNQGGDTKTMTIKKDIVVDSQYIHDIEQLGKLGYSVGKLDESRPEDCFVRDSNNPDVGKLYIQKCKIPFPYAYMDLQGDLFSGFNTDPICNINWSSPKQLIPFFEMLGFNLEVFDKATRGTKKSVGKDVIKSQSHISDIAPIYVRYKDTAKICQAFGQNWLNAINPKSGRIHVDFHQLGTATARLSSGGGPYKLNLQQLPHDAITRACFTAEKGNKWISCDYDSQESQILASVANDPAMLELYRTGCGDMHSLVAKMSYSNIIPKDIRIEDIKRLYPEQRQDSKGIEFSINYGGDATTIAKNKGIPMKEAEGIYNNYMSGFPGVKTYQDECRKMVIRDGFIVLNPVTNHRSHIQDWEELKSVRDAMQNPQFWNYIDYLKKYDKQNPDLLAYKKYKKRKSDIEKNAINYKIQGRGAMCFKFAATILFNWIKSHGLLNIVKICVPVHDEINVEAPESMAQEVSGIVVKAMEKGAKPFCTRLNLSASPEINDYWVH